MLLLWRLILYLYLCGLLLANAKSSMSMKSGFHLISSNGTLARSRLFSNYTESFHANKIGDSIIGVLSLDHHNGADYTNSIFNTNFSSTMRGLCMERNGWGAVLYGAFDKLASTEFCSVKAIELFDNVTDMVVVMMPAIAIKETLISSEQLLRRVARYVLHGGHCLFVVGPGGHTEPNSEDSIHQKMQELLIDVAKTLSVSHAEADGAFTRVTVASLDESAQAVGAVVRAKLKEGTTASDAASRRSDIVTRLRSLPNRWRRIPRQPTLELSSEQLQSLFEIERAYQTTIDRTKRTISRWRSRVAAPLLPTSSSLPVPTTLLPAGNQVRTVGRFPEQVSRLLDDTRSFYLAATSGSVMVKERTARLTQLIRYVTAEVRGVFEEQVRLLRLDAKRRMRGELVRLATNPTLRPPLESAPSTSTASKREAEAAAIGRVLTSFKTLTDALAVDSLGLCLDDQVHRDLEEELQRMRDEYASSATAKSLSVQSLDRVLDGGADSSSPRRRRVGVALTVVGLLRPPGFGNLQGVVNYDASNLFGGLLPTKFMLGFQNDGDTPEVLADDRDHPLLRIQPRIHLDIDF